MKKFFITLITLIIIVSGCKKNINNSVKHNDSSVKINNFNPKINYQINNLKIPKGQPVKIKITSNDQLDSIILYLNGIKDTVFTTDSIDFQLNTEKLVAGKNNIDIRVFKNHESKMFSKKLSILSPFPPKLRTYKIIAEYPHDDKAYTQGLCYYKGSLYESTGLETESTIRKVDLKTGKVLNTSMLQNNYFGEGITILNDQIYQLTWQNHVGFIYNVDNFQKTGQFNYNTEGWGITTDKQILYMSDGTNIIYKLSPQTLTVIGKIEVYDNKKPVMYLNELEYFNNRIYANVYTKDYIVSIDPKTGFVLEKIDLTNILPASLRKPSTDVLNGIAYDEQNNRIFVTGKNWPRLYQIKIVDKK